MTDSNMTNKQHLQVVPRPSEGRGREDRGALQRQRRVAETDKQKEGQDTVKIETQGVRLFILLFWSKKEDHQNNKTQITF